MKCSFCGKEINSVYSDGAIYMKNVHFNENGHIEKCYRKRIFPFNLIYGARNYKGICAEYEWTYDKANRQVSTIHRIDKTR